MTERGRGEIENLRAASLSTVISARRKHVTTETCHSPLPPLASFALSAPSSALVGLFAQGLSKVVKNSCTRASPTARRRSRGALCGSGRHLAAVAMPPRRSTSQRVKGLAGKEAAASAPSAARARTTLTVRRLSCATGRGGRRGERLQGEERAWLCNEEERRPRRSAQRSGRHTYTRAHTEGYLGEGG